MKIIQRIIYTGFAAVSIASASMPVFPAYTMQKNGVVQHGPDFEWYARAGRPAYVVDSRFVQPPAREGYIWSPARWEWNGRRHVLVQGHWVRDDYLDQLAQYNPEARAMIAQGLESPVILIERR